MKNAHDLTAQGTGASRTMPFKNFVLDPPSRNFFSPSSSPLPSFCDVGPPPLPLARSPGLGSKTMFPLFIDEYYYCATLPPRFPPCESTRSTRNYSIRGRDSSRGNVKIICRKEVVRKIRKIRKGSRWIKFFFFFRFSCMGI